MDIHVRRGHLVTANSPETRLDYVVSLSGSLRDLGHIHVRYVPDRLILTPNSFARYLDALETISWTHLEEVAAAILTDLNNELVARWVQVALSHADSSLETDHHILLEDRQPNWNNAQLLSRLSTR